MRNTEERTTTGDSLDQDLHGQNCAHQHAGVHDIRMTSADQIKELHDRLSDFDNRELARIPILLSGEPLQQGAIYLDLAQENSEPFAAHGAQSATDENWFVPKAICDYEIWNRLIG
ncbi:MAG: hypothetical protein OHK0029_23700 [Armatimonadaceae bacterium]